MTSDTIISTGAFVPTAILSGVFSHRVSTAWWIAIAVVLPIELMGIGPLLDANHPLRIGLPFVLGGIAYSEMRQDDSVWPNLSRAYVMAMLTLALAGVDLAALLFRELGGAWIVPAFTTMVCLSIWAVALVPKEKVPWLRS